MRNTPIIIFLAVFLSGCSVAGPNYRKPDSQVPSNWKNQQAKADGTHMGRWGQWWSVFKDPDLDDLEAQALLSNEDLKSAVASVDRARAIARVNSAAFVPEINLDPSYERQRTTKNASTMPAFAESTTNNHFKVPLDLSYEVDIWGKVRRAFEAGHAEAEASEEAYRTVLLTLTADVAQNYFLLRELDAEIETIRQTIALRQRAADVVKDRVEGGVSSELDLSRATTELAQAQADIIDVQRRRAQIENALAVLCGTPASDFRVDSKPLDVTPPSIPAGLPSDILRQRPDIAESERLLAAASARIGVAQAEFFPSVTLTGSAGFESVDADNLFDWESRVASLGPSVKLPIFSGGRNAARLKAARADYQIALATYQKRVLVAFQETEDALVAIRLRGEQLEAQARLVKAAQRTSELSNERYKQGLVNYLEVVDSERSRLDAELGALQIKTEQIIATVHLVKSIGGSW